MASLTKFAGTVSQTTGGKYCSFSDLNNIRNSTSDSWAVSSVLIQGKSETPNRPSTITGTNFGFNLPQGAEPTKVVVTYRHQKVAGSDWTSKDKHMLNVPAPYISVMGVGTGSDGFSIFRSKGVAPTTSMVTSTKTFNVAGKVSRAQVNSSNFGFRINYPANSNAYNGYMRVSYVKVTVEYKTSQYGYNVSKVSGGYNEEEYTVQLSISNKNLTSFNPSLTLTSPVGFSFVSSNGTGTVTQSSARSFTWNPKLSSKVGTSSINLVFMPDVTYPSGQSSYTGTFTLSESLYGTSKDLSVTITERPPTPSEESEGGSVLDDGDTASVEEMVEINVISGNDFILNLDEIVGTDYTNLDYLLISFFKMNGNDISYDSTYHNKGAWGSDYYYTFYPENMPVEGYWNITKPSYYKVRYEIVTTQSSNTSTRYGYFYVNVIPEETDLTTPFFTVLEPSEEEYDRLGDGYPYIVQSFMKHTTTDTNVRDWYKNNRIGVCNNAPHDLFSDACTSINNKSDGYYVGTGSYSLDSDGMTIDASTFSSNNYQANIRLDNNVYTVPYEVSFDLIADGNDNFRLYFHNSSFSNSAIGSGTLWTSPNGELTQVRFIVTEDGITRYIGENETTLTLSESVASKVGCRFGYWQTTQSSIKISNYRVTPIIEEWTDTAIFENADYWSEETAGLNEYANVECEFPYNSEYPLYIICTGDYPEATTYGYDIGTVSYTEPCIIEKTVYNGNEANGNYPTPIINLISDEGTSEANIPTLNNTNPVIIYDYPLDDGYGTNEEMSVRGIEVTGDIEQSDELVITGKLKAPTGEVGERTTIINNEDYTIDNDTQFSLGGLGDNWGFNTTDITNLEDWELELTINNILLEDVANINFGNIQIIIYIETLEKQPINIKINGEDLSYYGAFIENAKIPEGLETDTDFLTIDGTDTNDAYRQNIREKTIELELTLGECDLQTSTDMLRQLAKLLVNEKDSYNRPIPNRIEFSHYPDVYFEYIMKEAFDVEAETSYYNIKAKLVIPSGTAFSKETTTTNITGYVQGLAAVSPIISFKPQSNVIEINESVSSQRFSMGYDGDWQSKIVELDCANRIAYLKTNEDDTQPIDISKYVDFNSDWFALKGEYSFSGTNCVIRRVEYTERW